MTCPSNKNNSPCVLFARKCRCFFCHTSFTTTRAEMQPKANHGLKRVPALTWDIMQIKWGSVGLLFFRTWSIYGCFRKIVGKIPPNHPIGKRVFHYFHHPFWGFYPYFWKHLFVWVTKILQNISDNLELSFPSQKLVKPPIYQPLSTFDAWNCEKLHMTFWV